MVFLLRFCRCSTTSWRLNPTRTLFASRFGVPQPMRMRATLFGTPRFALAPRLRLPRERSNQSPQQPPDPTSASAASAGPGATCAETDAQFPPPIRPALARRAPPTRIARAPRPQAHQPAPSPPPSSATRHGPTTQSPPQNSQLERLPQQATPRCFASPPKQAAQD